MRDDNAVALRPGMVSVGSIRTPVTSPPNSAMSSTVASPRTVAAFSSGGSQYAALVITAPVSSLISGIRVATPVRARRACHGHRT